MLFAHWDLGLLEFRDQVIRESCTEMSYPQSQHKAPSVDTLTWMHPSLSKYLTLVPKLLYSSSNTFRRKKYACFSASSYLRSRDYRFPADPTLDLMHEF